jgi:hypothetical protein
MTRNAMNCSRVSIDTKGGELCLVNKTLDTTKLKPHAVKLKEGVNFINQLIFASTGFLYADKRCLAGNFRLRIELPGKYKGHKRSAGECKNRNITSTKHKSERCAKRLYYMTTRKVQVHRSICTNNIILNYP